MKNLSTKTAFFAAFLTAGLSCSCFFQTFEERFCSTKISLRAKIVAKFDNCPGTCDPIEDQVNGKIFYLATVTEKFKGSTPRFIVLQTAVNGALCGVNLTVGKDYLLNLGRPSAEYLYFIGLCDFPTQWSSLTPSQIQFVKSNANNGAGCPS